MGKLRDAAQAILTLEQEEAEVQRKNDYLERQERAVSYLGEFRAALGCDDLFVTDLQDPILAPDPERLPVVTITDGDDHFVLMDFAGERTVYIWSLWNNQWEWERLSRLEEFHFVDYVGWLRPNPNRVRKRRPFHHAYHAWTLI